MATRRSAKPLCAGSIPAYASRKPLAKGVFWRRASKLLCLRAESKGGVLPRKLARSRAGVEKIFAGSKNYSGPIPAYTSR